MALSWNVWTEEHGAGIVLDNIFEHPGFMDDLVKARKRWGKLRGATAEDRVVFECAVDRALMYHFWSKCEWEVVITPWPPLVSEDMSADQYHRFCKESRKVDVYTQVKANWSQFEAYLWEHRGLILEYEKETKRHDG